MAHRWIVWCAALLLLPMAVLVARPWAQDNAAPLPDKPDSELGALGRTARWQALAAPLIPPLRAALQAQKLDDAEALCRQWIEKIPQSPDGYFNLAGIQTRRGHLDEAFSSLDKAIDIGFREAALLQSDDDLRDLRSDPRFEGLLKKIADSKPPPGARTAEPAAIVDGVALVADANTAVDQRMGVFRPLFLPAEKPVHETKLTTIQGPAGELVRRWWGEGTAAGYQGDFYDNRDAKHSSLPPKLFPQLVRVEYGPEAQALELHRGLPENIFHSGVVLGNASLAVTGPQMWRSMPRLGMSSPRGIAMLHAQYSHNQLYVYPCHNDYLPGHNGKLPESGAGSGAEPDDAAPDDRNGTNGPGKSASKDKKAKSRGHGDVYFAHTPYLLISQGSSGSDQPFLQALALTLAAFRPEVKQFLVEQNALAPTLQVVFRSSTKRIRQADDYFTGHGHPAVFQRDDLDPERMVRRAHELSRETIPPLVALQVVEEDEPLAGRDYFDVVATEKIWDTPAAIARVMRGTAQRRRMVVSAEGSRDLNGQPLEWRWVVLQGDAGAVRITPMNTAGSRVEISVPWHARRPVSPGSELETNRVDVACFAGHGNSWSAPAFLTWYCPDNEEREYDAEGRIRAVTYNGNYVDPVIVTARQWRDEYVYDPSGTLLGWTRIRGKARQEFTAEGRRIVARDPQGTPKDARAVRYVAEAKGPNQLPTLVQQDVAEDEAP